jgi:hypothetical protein
MKQQGCRVVGVVGAERVAGVEDAVIESLWGWSL